MVIVGGRFAGLACARRLGQSNKMVKVTAVTPRLEQQVFVRTTPENKVQIPGVYSIVR